MLGGIFIFVVVITIETFLILRLFSFSRSSSFLSCSSFPRLSLVSGVVGLPVLAQSGLLLQIVFYEKMWFIPRPLPELQKDFFRPVS